MSNPDLGPFHEVSFRICTQPGITRYTTAISMESDERKHTRLRNRHATPVQGTESRLMEHVPMNTNQKTREISHYSIKYNASYRRGSACGWIARRHWKKHGTKPLTSTPEHTCTILLTFRRFGRGHDRINRIRRQTPSISHGLFPVVLRTAAEIRMSAGQRTTLVVSLLQTLIAKHGIQADVQGLQEFAERVYCGAQQ
jgi:hypothetical protein